MNKKLDVEVYEKIFDGKVALVGEDQYPIRADCSQDERSLYRCQIPSFSSDINTAYEVVNKIISDDRSIGFYIGHNPIMNTWTASFASYPVGESKHLTVAICIAALHYNELKKRREKHLDLLSNRTCKNRAAWVIYDIDPYMPIYACDDHLTELILETTERIDRIHEEDNTTELCCFCEGK